MRVVVSKVFPFEGFMACNLFGLVFVRPEFLKRSARYQSRTIQHEAIHGAQMKELLYIGFYIIYLVEWIYWGIFRTEKAYRHINFEKEAFSHESDPGYLERRRHYAQWK